MLECFNGPNNLKPSLQFSFRIFGKKLAHFLCVYIPLGYFAYSDRMDNVIYYFYAL